MIKYNIKVNRKNNLNTKQVIANSNMIVQVAQFVITHLADGTNLHPD
jgi:hypothetical protein